MATDFRLKDQLPKITDRIVQTYDDVGKTNHLGHCPLPNYEEIIAATNELKEILYPGYRRREGLHRGNVAYYVGDLLDMLHDRLTRQIGRACATKRAPPTIATRIRTTRHLARPRHCSSSNACRSFARRWPPTSRPPSMATPPANRSTR